ncbi:MAG: UvrB/UvrC motif-containing protein [Planctomycetaceae bacterium]|nr:UvrB/UvrC motif-containing protein [Planctomycetaceae bacterium]
MKCQKCDRPATFHITELTGNKPQELHLCEEHARHYLSESSEGLEAASGLSASMAQNMVQQMSLSQASEELKEIDQKTCTICGITFFDFRSRGRLGCPNDYTCFGEQLDPLILGIHGESQHVGKRPKRSGKADDPRTHLIRLRRELDEAVAREDYEKASELRDQIKTLNEK